MKLSDQQVQECKRLIFGIIDEHDLPFPDDLESGKVYKSGCYKYQNRGSRELRFKIIHRQSAEFVIDIYFITDSYTWHKRIEKDGKVTDLENFEAQFGWPVFDDEAETREEHARITKHNNLVMEILKEKGFEK